MRPTMNFLHVRRLANKVSHLLANKGVIDKGEFRYVEVLDSGNYQILQACVTMAGKDSAYLTTSDEEGR